MGPTAVSRGRLPSVTSVTFRRGLYAGRLFLGVGLMISLILTTVLLRSPRGAVVFEATFPLEVPLFASLGAMGGMMLFVSDRSKGVLEYLIAYGIRPGTLFVNCLLTTVGLSSIVLGSALAVGLGGFLATGHPLTTDLENSVLGYTIPMTYASSLFAASCGMIWSTLSTPRIGYNSQAGVAPLLGVAPPMLVLILAEAVDRSQYYYVTVGASLGFVALVAVLLLASTRLMGRERYLSAM